MAEDEITLPPRKRPIFTFTDVLTERENDWKPPSITMIFDPKDREIIDSARTFLKLWPETHSVVFKPTSHVSWELRHDDDQVFIHVLENTIFLQFRPAFAPLQILECDVSRIIE